jgi:hypothetical protein
MSVIKLVGAGSIKSAERRKLRRLGRIAARRLRAVGVYTPARVWVSIYFDEGGCPTSVYTPNGGTWVERPRVYDGEFSWAAIKSCRPSAVQRVRKPGTPA